MLSNKFRSFLGLLGSFTLHYWHLVLLTSAYWQRMNINPWQIGTMQWIDLLELMTTFLQIFHISSTRHSCGCKRLVKRPYSTSTYLSRSTVSTSLTMERTPLLNLAANSGWVMMVEICSISFLLTRLSPFSSYSRKIICRENTLVNWNCYQCCCKVVIKLSYLQC